jgi:ribosomal protein L35AE/L33A
MMKTSRLGCFSISAIIAAFLTAAIITGFAVASGGMLFSAGPLNAKTGTQMGGVTSHAEIAGQCNLCHVPFWGTETMGDRCVVCHADVLAQWQDPSTLHGVLRKNNPDLACRNCHPEHRGADSPLIDLSNAYFPHNAFGYSLASHPHKADGSQFTCTDCHGMVYTPPFDQNMCANCHGQIDAKFYMAHVQTFGGNCLACHDGLDSFGSNFNHNKNAAFRLNGKHAQVACGQCHINISVLADLKSAPQDCFSCHQKDDRHQARLGPDCGSCHTPEGWSSAKFDHNLSAFALTGKHVTVPCANCHVDKVLQGTPSDCFSCHQRGDKHKGTLGTNCASCHTPDGWKPSTFDHKRSAFQLTGKHVTVDCLSCHANDVFKGTPADCYACHQKNDNHNGSLGIACGNCHTTDAWKPAHFNHDQASFHLNGAHLSVACTSCHVNNVYKGTPSDCNACHQKDDHHNGQLGTICASCHTTTAWKPANYNHNLAAFHLTGAHLNVACMSCHVNNIYKGTPSDCYACHQKNDHHNGAYGVSCNTCHSTAGWLPATFNHNLAAFQLTGAHVSVACVKCHVNNVFKGTPSNCYACHQKNDHHNGAYGVSCSTCHSTSGWLPATFNHNLAAFKLTGAHISVACASCHINNVFKGTPSNCYACHQKNDTHNGTMGTSCATCHSTNAWKPSTFNHATSPFPLTGAHISLACSQCHASGVYHGLSTACAACHAEPAIHAGQFGTNCAQCHTTSNWNATFSHSTFPLTGAHTTLTCSQCHASGVYHGLSTACAACHAAPSTHAGMSGNCTQCHSTSAWKPANFSHPGGCEGNCANHQHATCADCHPANYPTYTCLSCHKNNNP